MLVQQRERVMPVTRREKFRLPIFAGKGIEREMNLMSRIVEQAARHNEPVLLAELGPGNGPELTINACTHGDETIGMEILATLLQKADIRKGKLRLIIGNTPAVVAGKRFVENDLNRITPGDASKTGEMELAPKLLDTLNTGNPDSFVIDVHTASVASPAFAIVNRPDEKSLQLAEQTGLANIVLMGSENSPKSGAVTDHVPCGIGIELGKHGEGAAYQEGMQAVENVLHALGMTKEKKLRFRKRKKTYFQIQGSIPRIGSVEFHPEFQNFKSVALGQEVYTSGGESYLRQTFVAAKPFTPVLISTLPTNSLFLIGEEVGREKFLPKSPDVLFICQANVGRSQMAEGFFNSLTQGRFLATSAGVVDVVEKYHGHPASEIAAVMQEEGIDVAEQAVKMVTPEMVERAKQVIVLCKPEECPEFVQKSDKTMYIPVEDPFGMGIEGTREVRDRVKQLVESLISEQEFAQAA